MGLRNEAGFFRGENACNIDPFDTGGRIDNRITDCGFVDVCRYDIKDQARRF
jgi:hypothetical protein